MSDQAIYELDTVVALLQAKEYARLLEYVRKSAECGVSEAECELGNIYFCGQGVPADPVEAERWLTKAALQNNPVAWNNLGTLYSSYDAQKSKQWYKRAVELGFMSAAHLAK